MNKNSAASVKHLQSEMRSTMLTHLRSKLTKLIEEHTYIHTHIHIYKSFKVA